VDVILISDLLDTTAEREAQISCALHHFRDSTITRYNWSGVHVLHGGALLPQSVNLPALLNGALPHHLPHLLGLMLAHNGFQNQDGCYPMPVRRQQGRIKEASVHFVKVRQRQALSVRLATLSDFMEADAVLWGWRPGSCLTPAHISQSPCTPQGGPCCPAGPWCAGASWASLYASSLLG
jgi:hypothetical protein